MPENVYSGMRFTGLLIDLRLALRLVWQDWRFSLTLVGTLAIGIAASGAIFNVVNAALFIGFVSQLARLVTYLVPDRGDDAFAVQARHLDRDLVATPELALARTRQEIMRMASRSLPLPGGPMMR